MIEFTRFSISILVVIIIILLYHVYLAFIIDTNNDGKISEKELEKYYGLPCKKNIKNSFISGAVRGLAMGSLVTQSVTGALKYSLILGLLNPTILIFETRFC